MLEDLRLLRPSRSILLQHALQAIVNTHGLLGVARKLMGDHEAEPRATDLRPEEKVVVPDLDGLRVLTRVCRERHSIPQDRDVVRVLLACHRERLGRLVPVAARLGEDAQHVPRDVRRNVLLDRHTSHRLGLLGLGCRSRRRGEREGRVERQRLEREGLCQTSAKQAG